MFDNIGNKLKQLARIYTYAGLILLIPSSVLIIRVCFSLTVSFLLSVLICAIIAIIYIFFIYLTGSLIYAVGEMTDNSNYIRNYTRETRDKAANIEKNVVLIDGFLIKNPKDNRKNNEDQEK